MKGTHLAAAGALALILLFAAYANHFHNSFQFDDWAAVAQNQSIHSLHNIPKFFTDATTVTTELSNQVYRPLQTLSLAIDYHLAGGVEDTLWFHISTFFWYVVLLVLMYAMYARLASPEVAFIAAALFGLHPASAESVNYIVQRSEIYSTLGAVAALAIFIYWPRARKFGLYLIPVILGALFKPLSLMFLPILFVYLHLYEDARFWPAVRKCIPTAITVTALYVLQAAMASKTFSPGGTSAVRYWLTQPIVILHYVSMFLFPVGLSADSDRGLVRGVFSLPVLIGAVFLAAALWLTWWTYRAKDMRPVAFGLLWFWFALLPTSIPPLLDVENDHRMFFPFVGLTLAAVWAAWRYLNRRVFFSAAAVILLACAWGTHVRNQVWSTEETLWKDCIEKSPRNARALINYALALTTRNDYVDAVPVLERAEKINAKSFRLKTNMAMVYGMIGENAKAEAYFRQALADVPNDASTLMAFADYLRLRHRVPEAVQLLKFGVAANPEYIYTRYLLMDLMRQQGDGPGVRALALDTLRRFPNDEVAKAQLAAMIVH